MKKRAEFSRKVKAIAFQRAKGRCEGCGSHLAVGKFHYDHARPDALDGAPVLDNCRVLCLPCHREKTASDVRRLRKADRQRDFHIGARLPARRPMPFGRRSGLKKKITGEVVPR